MELTPIEKLDAVLTVFDPKIPSPAILKNRIIVTDSLGRKNILIDDRQLLEILTKLVKDGYLSEQNSKANIKGKDEKAIDYSLTFDGELLIYQGGYKAMFYNQTLVKNHAEQVEKAIQVNNRWIAIGTILAAILTFLILIYYCILFYYDHLWLFRHCHACH